ncbi:MAG: PAS domain-containing protein [Candidatus Omnitrophica bacterium]|nr:PAS domain-containing protein [Candidatus Omnitrophota bacterium]
MKPKKRKRLSASKEVSLTPEAKLSLLTELVDQIPDVIYFKDRKGRLILVNKAHAKGTGLKADEVRGKTDFDFFPSSRARIMAKDDSYVFQTGKAIVDKIERATRVDGVDNYVTTTKIPRFDKKGNVIGLMGITRDITARVQLEQLKEEKEKILRKLQVLEEMTKMKSEFLSVVSHELNTPLIIVKEALSLVADGIAGKLTPKQKDLILKATSNLERLKRMIDDLLDMSRIEKHKLVLHYSLVNFNELLLASSDFFIKWAEEKNIHLTYQLPPRQINIFIDAERISQVISNLINNAIKFTERNGKIKVEVSILETKVRVSVIDTGIGIAEKDFPKLFRKFSQVNKDMPTRKRGVGLGLSIAKELIEKHGGEIWVESKPGQGSRFYFTLPRFYTEKALDKGVRERINSLLDKRISIYLINILIVNFNSFKRRITVKPHKLFKDLKSIIDRTLRELRRPEREKPQVILEGYQRGEWSILFPETKEGEAVGICDAFKARIDKYFSQHKVKGVFINLGIMSYFQKDQDSTTKHLLSNLHVKRISIGSEIRKHKRIEYRADIDVFFADNKRMPSQAVDISQGGMAFALERSPYDTASLSDSGLSLGLDQPLKTDATIDIVLKPMNSRKLLRIKGRVAWMRQIEENISGSTKKYYKVGVEFVKINEAKKKQIKRLLASLSAAEKKKRGGK